MDNKTVLPGDDIPQELQDKLNKELPNFFSGMGDIKNQLGGLEEALNKFKNLAGDKIKISQQKRGFLFGKEVQVTLMANEEIYIKWADKGEGKKFFDKVK